MFARRNVIQAVRSLRIPKPARITTPKSYVRAASSGRSRNRSLRTPILYFSGPSPQSLHFHTAIAFSEGITPDAEDPAPKEAPRERVTQPTDIKDEEYHELSDRYLDAVVARLEEIQESREDLDVEFSAGVLTVSIPTKGTYVINKQPPNKQIWLSSPITGPKRYDWVMRDGMHQKQGTGEGTWIYLRDGSSLTDLLRDELEVSLEQ
ncbi:MAG: hypothetical protein Q9165_005931 [Trypethelium subeluteriae]